VSRHGDRLPEVLIPLRASFESLQRELLVHMGKEDAVLFAAVTALEASAADASSPPLDWAWIEQPIDVMEAEHESAGAALAAMRELTRGYAPPAGACPPLPGSHPRLCQPQRHT